MNTHFHIYRRIVFVALCVIIISFCIVPLSHAATDPNTVRLQVPIGNLTEIKVCDTVDEVLTCNGVATLLGAAYIWIVTVASIVAVVALMAGGLRWTMSRGNSGEIGKAKKMIQNALMGLVLLLGSYSLLYFINPSLTRLPTLTLGKPVTKLTLVINYINDLQTKVTSTSPTDTQSNIEALKAALEKAGQACQGKFTITPDLAKVRTWEEQKALYDLYLSGKGNLACDPGTKEQPRRCPHMAGFAVDLKNACNGSQPNPVAASCMKQAGFNCILMGNTPQKECWHYELGSGLSSGCVDPANYK